MERGTRLLLAIALCIGLAVSLTACSGGGGDGDIPDINFPPVANAGPDQSVTTGTEATLDGSGSWDADLHPLGYSWSFTSVPTLSAITNLDLSDAAAMKPAFTPDVDGEYIVRLIVNDGTVDSAADTVTITASTTGNSAPVANAGPDRSVTTGTVVTLDGSGSSDADLDPLTYSWSFTSVPTLSAITNLDLSDAAAMKPTFTPDADGPYVLQLIVNDGTVDSAADTVTITAGAAKSWGTAEIIDAGANDAFAPHVAVDPGGNAIAVWYQSDGTYNNIYANRYVPGTGWGTAELVETGTGQAWEPRVAVDAGGNAIAVWYHYDGSTYNIHANRYVPGTGWGTAEIIETGTGQAWAPRVAVDPGGNAIAVWFQWDGAYWSIYANRYVPGTGWGTAEPIETSSYLANAPQVAVDSGGNAIAVWEQFDGTNYSIYANRYVPGTGWGTAELVETSDYPASNPQVAFDSGGNAIAVWRQVDGSYYSIYANRYVPGTGWGTAEIIESGANDAFSPQVAVDSGGNAIAVWRQYDGSSYNIHANHYDAVSKLWGTAELIETGLGDAVSPQVAVDAGGDAIAVWGQYDGTDVSTYANRYVPGTGWGAAEIIESGANDVYNPQVAVDSGGNAIAVWQQSSDICANRFE